jgi:Zn-dependent M28 family amino/carboxypeptidase
MAASAVLALVASSLHAPPAGAATDATASEQLQDAVTVKKVLRHLTKFQDIAEDNDGNRVAGSAGYDTSAEYVHDKLVRAGYDVEYQEFEFLSFTELSPPTFAQIRPEAKSYVVTEDFATAEFSGTGTAEATAQFVDVLLPPPAEPGSTSGCEPADFAGFTAGNIALIQRGTCTFEIKVRNAQAAGAAAVILFNEGQPGRTEVVAGTLTSPADVPVIGTTFALGSSLDGATVRITTDTESVPKTTRNVIAETRGGDDDSVVMAGAHLDSVAEGPGYNDNGTGSAAILEVALRLAEAEDEPANTVRFAWWGAEESGLVGSTYYVGQLGEDKEDIALYLNFDMVGSPNYYRGVYDGDGSSFGTAGPAGSAAIEEMFNKHFANAGLAYEGTAFSGRSDYAAFIASDIPAGGLFTGAENVKTPEQVARYGGVVDVAADPCYHARCDSADPVADGADAAVYGQLTNLAGNANTLALDTNADAIAHAVATYAYDATSVTGG